MNFLGKIIKVRSNKGEVVCASPLENLSTLEKGSKITATSEKYRKELEIESLRHIKGDYVVKFVGVNTINEALRLVGYSIQGDIPDPPPNDNTLAKDPGYDYHNLEDFSVKDIHDQLWGTVTDYDEYGLNKLLEVQGETQTYYVPVTDTIIKEIDRGNRMIIIDPPEGLKDLNIK